MLLPNVVIVLVLGCLSSEAMCQEHLARECPEQGGRVFTGWVTG